VQLGCRYPDSSREYSDTEAVGHDWTPDRWPTLSQPDLCEPTALLRRPFSLAGRGDDDEGTWIDVIHRVVGVGTAWLSSLKPGDAVDMIGPLGNWFSLPQGKSIGLLVGGGVGLPPMFYLAEAMRLAGWSAVGFIGATTADLLAVHFAAGVTPDSQGVPTLCVDEFARHGFASVITTDDGSVGLHGRVTRGLEAYVSTMSPEDIARAMIYVCGPEPMMHAIARVADAHGLDCQVCLEQAMACGMGTCQSCVVKIEDHSHSPHAVTESGRPWRYRLACTDGPIFNAPLVIW
jgi:dihydroorotate dehydrogenase electron transfer subunit